MRQVLRLFRTTTTNAVDCGETASDAPRTMWPVAIYASGVQNEHKPGEV